MKLTKKLSLAAIATAMFVSPLTLGKIDSSAQNTSVYAASLKGKINFVKNSNKPLLYNKNGVAFTKQPSFNFNHATKFYGSPIIRNGAKNYAQAFVFGMPQAIIKSTRYIDLGDGGYIKWNNVGSYNWRSGVFTLDHNSYVYDKNGRRLTTYRGQKAYYKKNAKVTYAGKNYVYFPNSYLNVGKGYYVNTDAVNNMDGKGVLKLNHNSYVYNKKGKRISYNGKKKLLKYDLINYSGRKRTKTSSDKYYYYASETSSKKSSVKNYKIKGQYYYYLGNGAYIKAANVGVINGHAVYSSGATTIVPKSDLYIYDSSFKQTKKSVTEGKTIKVDATTTTGQGDATQRWFRIAGTKGKNAQWLLWGDDSTYGYLPAENNGYFTIRTRI